MQELLDKGNLEPAFFASALNTLEHGVGGLGINLKSLMSADSQEFEKLSNDFLKNVKDVFGSRITQYEVQAFLKTIPTLSQTDAGKQRVINNLMQFNDIVALRKEAMDDIIAQHGGRRPPNMETLVEKRIKPALDKVSHDFEMQYGKRTPKYWKDPFGFKKAVRRYVPYGESIVGAPEKWEQ